MSHKVILILAAGGISFATAASAFPLNPQLGGNGAVEARMVCDSYGHCWNQLPAPIPRATPRFEGRSIYRHKGYMYDPVEGRHYDRTRSRWVTDVGSPPGR
jgi:hypothetical protein